MRKLASAQKQLLPQLSVRALQVLQVLPVRRVVALRVLLDRNKAVHGEVLPQQLRLPLQNLPRLHGVLQHLRLRQLRK